MCDASQLPLCAFCHVVCVAYHAVGMAKHFVIAPHIVACPNVMWKLGVWEEFSKYTMVAQGAE